MKKNLLEKFRQWLFTAVALIQYVHHDRLF